MSRAFNDNRCSIGFMDEIFPEPKESEDERIRKELLAWLKSTDGQTLPMDRYNAAIAWLEKKGEQKPVEPTDLRTWKYIVDAVLTEREGIGQYIDSPWTTEVAEKLQKRFGNIEQKPVELEKEEKSRLMKKCVHRAYQQGYDTGFHIATTELEHKQEWSEEDEVRLNDVIRLIENSGHVESIRKHYIDWLKSLRPQEQQYDDEWSDEDKEFLKLTLSNLTELKDRYGEGYGRVGECIKWLNSLQPQPIDVEAVIAYQDGYQKAELEFSQKQQEWTQEDIDMIDWLIRCCEKEHEELCNDRYGHQDIVSDLKRDCRKKWDWLESLKGKVAPQKQWKPSEEQMIYLSEAIDVVTRAEKFSIVTALKELREQLKKLREE